MIGKYQIYLPPRVKIPSWLSKNDNVYFLFVCFNKLILIKKIIKQPKSKDKDKIFIVLRPALQERKVFFLGQITSVLLVRLNTLLDRYRLQNFQQFFLSCLQLITAVSQEGSSTFHGVHLPQVSLTMRVKNTFLSSFQIAF